MTNYVAVSALATAIVVNAASAAEPPAPARPAVAAGIAHYVQAPAGSTLNFSFQQAGAEDHGEFRQFTTVLDYDEKNLAASSLKVTVQTGSFETQDKDRNDTLASADLLDPKKFPTAQFVASTFAQGAKGVEAVGKLTLHGVTKDLRVPLTIKTTATGAEISGEITLKRLDYGIGQGDWKSTEWVGDEVKLQYKVALIRAAR
ncbi:MAG: YceI family protein [Pseudomonadota bacterium]